MPPSAASVLGLDRWATLSADWRRALTLVVAVWAVLFVLFHSDWAAMAGQWWNSSTYNHVLLIPLIIVWLVHQRLPELVKIEPTGWWPGLVLAGLAMLLWAMGVFAGIATGRQLGVVLLHMAAVATLLGPRLTAGLVFPLGYMLFLVPFGDELVPALQLITAELTIGLIHLSGVPAVIDGVFINTPAGLFEVAEACSGVKFLIAMVAFGALVANACFVSWKRRAIFMAGCIVVPIAANGIRAWGTIFIAQYVGAEIAAGYDHLIYGWIFFGIVLALVIGGAWRFFDRAVDDAVIDAAQVNSSPLLARLADQRIGNGAALAAFFAIALVGHGWTRAADSLAAPLPKQLLLPEVPGWTRADYAPEIWWEPRAGGADHRLLGRYVDGEGRAVDVFFAAYASQGDGREAGGYGEGAHPAGGAWDWLSFRPAIDDASGERLLANGRVTRLAETSYRTGDLTTGSNARLRIANMRDRMLLRARPTMVVILSAEEHDGQPAADAIDQFRRSLGPLDQWMDRLAGVR